MNIDPNPKLDFDDVLIVPQRSKHPSRKDVLLQREFKFYHSPRVWKGIPLIVSNLDTTGTFAMANTLTEFEIITCLHKFYEVKDLIDYFGTHNLEKKINYTWLSLGMRDGDLEKVCQVRDNIHKQSPPNLVVDVSNGYSDAFISFLSKVRKEFPLSIIMAGNVCTEEMVPEYILHGGVDIVKVGIGPGSLCLTRSVTGCGYPQLSAISECAFKAHGLYSDKGRLGLICGDGGCKTSGDICKGFCANADFLMIGGMLAGVEQCEGEWQYKPDSLLYEANRIFDKKGYRLKSGDPSIHLDKCIEEAKKTCPKVALKAHGMSSKAAMDLYHGGMADYKAPEGEEKLIPYKGPVEDVIKPILGGIRGCCSMIGAHSVKEMARCAKFVKINRIK